MLRLEEKQAAAATGQIRLAHAYQESLARHDITVAQILLTLEDTEERRRHPNARATLTTLLRMGTLPVINENDTVATTEIRVGDNDQIGRARVCTPLTNAHIVCRFLLEKTICNTLYHTLQATTISLTTNYSLPHMSHKNKN